MSVETHRVLIGACGWKHQAWLNNFYSEDLPEDWQLGFYSNEFPVVYVSASDWLEGSNLEIPDLADWTEDVSDSFRFILEVPEHVLTDEQRFVTALEEVKALGEFCLGLVFQLNPSICGDTKLFQRHVEMAQVITLVCIDMCGTTLTDEFKNILLKQNIAEIWDGESPAHESFKRGPLAICRISGNNLDMAGLRKVIEICLNASNDHCISVLCLDGEPPSMELLHNADILLNLL